MAKKTLLGSLEVVLGSNTAAFQRGLRESQKDLKKTADAGKGMGKTLTGVFGALGSKMLSLKGLVAGGLAAIGVYKLAAGLNAAAKEVDQLGKMSSRLGLGVQQLSALKFAAGEAGIEFEGLTKLFSRFQKTLGDVMGRGGSSITVGKAVIQLRDVNGQLKPTAALLGEVGEAMKAIGSQAERASIAQALFGSDGGDKFLQLLAEGGDFVKNLNEQTERARRLGVIFTDRDAKIMAAYNDALGRISAAFLGLRVTIMREIAPALTEIANKFAELTAAAPRLISAIFGGNLDQDQRTQLASAFLKLRDSLLTLFHTTGVSMGAVLIAGIHDTLMLAGPVIWKAMKSIALNAVTAFYDAIATILEELVTFDKSFAPGAVAWVTDFAEGIRDAGNALQRYKREAGFEITAGDLMGAGAATDGLLWSTIRSAAEGIRASVSGLGESADEIIKLGNAFGMVADEAAGAGAAAKGAGDEIEPVYKVMGEPVSSTFFDGVKQGFADMRREVENIASLGKSVFTSMGEQLSSGLAGDIVDAATSFDNFGKSVLATAESVAKSVAKMVIQFYLLRAITGAMGIISPSRFGGRTPMPGDIGPPREGGGFALGAAFSGGQHLKRYARGGVVNAPTIFPMANGAGLMGEAGPEAIMPLERVGGGKLGVNARGAGTVVNIIDQRQSGQQVTAQERTGPDGRRMLDVYIRDAVRTLVNSGGLDTTMRNNFGVGRAAVPR